MNDIRAIQSLNETELRSGLVGGDTSWHSQYKDSAYVYVGGLSYDLTEGDAIAVMSQYGEIVDVNLVRDRDTGKSKGFCFVAYEDQRSTILAVDNLNGFELLGRQLRVDHVGSYKKERAREDEDERKEQTERLRKAEVVRAWTQDGFNAKKDPTVRALTGADQQKQDRKKRKEEEKERNRQRKAQEKEQKRRRKDKKSRKGRDDDRGRSRSRSLSPSRTSHKHRKRHKSDRSSEK